MLYHPSKIALSDAEIAKVNAIDTKGGLVVRYIRKRPTAALVNDLTAPDAPPTKAWKVMRGTPLACLVAFEDEGKVFIGWSKRFDEKTPILPAKLKEAFEKVSNNRPEEILKALHAMLTTVALKDTEVSFSKTEARRIAIARGLKDTITLTAEGNALSDIAGQIPASVRRKLPHFLKIVERALKTRPANLIKQDKVLVAAV